MDNSKWLGIKIISTLCIVYKVRWVSDAERGDSKVHLGPAEFETPMEY